MGGPQQPQKTVGQISVEIGQLGRSNLFGGSGPDKESGETLAPESFGLGGWILPGEEDEGGGGLIAEAAAVDAGSEAAASEIMNESVVSSVVDK